MALASSLLAASSGLQAEAGKPAGAALPGAAAPAPWGKVAKVGRLVVRDVNAEERGAAGEITKKLVALGNLSGSEAAAAYRRVPREGALRGSAMRPVAGSLLEDRLEKSSDVEALNLMALTSLCLEKPADAEEWFRKSLAIDPNQPAVRDAEAQLERGGSSVR